MKCIIDNADAVYFDLVEVGQVAKNYFTFVNRLDDNRYASLMNVFKCRDYFMDETWKRKTHRDTVIYGWETRAYEWDGEYIAASYNLVNNARTMEKILHRVSIVNLLLKHRGMPPIIMEPAINDEREDDTWFVVLVDEFYLQSLARMSLFSGLLRCLWHNPLDDISLDNGFNYPRNTKGLESLFLSSEGTSLWVLLDDTLWQTIGVRLHDIPQNVICANMETYTRTKESVEAGNADWVHNNGGLKSILNAASGYGVLSEYVESFDWEEEDEDYAAELRDSSSPSLVYDYPQILMNSEIVERAANKAIELYKSNTVKLAV